MYAAFSTTTHFVERTVKTANYCSHKSRMEDRTSQLAICYNLVHNINDVTKDEMIAQKKAKGQSYKNEKKMKVFVGAVRNEQVLRSVWEMHVRIEKALRNEELRANYNAIADAVKFSSKESYRAVRVKKQLEKDRDKMQETRKPNQYERVTGFDITAKLKNQIRFHDVKQIYCEGIERELAVRGMVDLSALGNFTKKKDELKKLIAAESGVVNWKDVKFFSILSDYDWSILTSNV